MIPLHLIETFVLFGESLNLSKTAILLQQSQPSASRQIDQFQSYFKQNLFQFVGKSKTLTSYGKDVHHYYKNAILNLRDLQKNIDNMPFQNSSQRLIIAARAEILHQYISPLQFTFPTEFKSYSGNDIKEAMKIKTIDMAVTQDHFDSFYYIRRKLFSTKYVIALPKSWNTKAKSAHEWFEISRQFPFLSYDNNQESIIKNLHKGLELPKLNLILVASDWRIISKKIQQEAGWSIIPEEFSDNAKIHHIKADDIFKETKFYLYVKKELARNKNIKSVIEQLSE
jgi:DNA-binding transcriptional LysR family regulator